MNRWEVPVTLAPELDNWSEEYKNWLKLCARANLSDETVVTSIIVRAEFITKPIIKSERNLLSSSYMDLTLVVAEANCQTQVRTSILYTDWIRILAAEMSPEDFMLAVDLMGYEEFWSSVSHNQVARYTQSSHDPWTLERWEIMNQQFVDGG